eukprot:7762663-Pyramimonas_sp.AAC.1
MEAPGGHALPSESKEPLVRERPRGRRHGRTEGLRSDATDGILDVIPSSVADVQSKVVHRGSQKCALPE